jgi:hypothetical protein
MSKRLQVILDDAEMKEIKALADQQHISVSLWVRNALNRVRNQQPRGDAKRKIEAIRAATRHSFPTSDIETMLSEIESGYTRAESR